VQFHGDFHAATDTIKLSGAGSGEFDFGFSWLRLAGSHEKRPTYSGKGTDSREIGRSSLRARSVRTQCIEGTENLG
jgi:hypothetical protein